MPVDAARILSVLLGSAMFVAAILGGVAWQVSPIYPVLFDIQRRIGHVEAVVGDLDRRLPGSGRPAAWRNDEGNEEEAEDDEAEAAEEGRLLIAVCYDP